MQMFEHGGRLGPVAKGDVFEHDVAHGCVKWRHGSRTARCTLVFHTLQHSEQHLAVREMVDFLVAEKKMSRDDAYMLCSLAVDLHVTQAVDATKGVHASLAKSFFR